MFTWRRQRIGLMFVGGTAWNGSPVSQRGIRTASDLRPWMEAMAELSMIAEVDPILISGLGEPVTPAVWEKLAGQIYEIRQQVDGLVVLHEPQTAALTAALIAAMVRSSGIPIVVTPGRSDGREGGRANLINALQTATTDVAGVVYLDGNTLYDASTMTMPAPEINGAIVGRVDFGVRLIKQRKRRPEPLAIVRHLESRVQVVNVTPWQAPQIDRDTRGLVLAIDPLTDPTAISWSAIKLPARIAIVIAGRRPERIPRTWAHLDVPPLIAMLRLMVALGERPTNWRRSLNQVISAQS